jgi:CheY-like chemotaxis protein
MDKILLVDDVKLLREIQKGLLATSPVQILTASNGLEALSIVRNEMPSVIVMDNHMPHMDGVTCCREIKTDPLLRHIPVVMVTNAVKHSDREEYLAAGASDWLSKPIDGKLFLTTLKKHLPCIECRAIRVPLCTEVRVFAATGFHTGKSLDISMKGILITSEFQPSPGDELRIEFVLPGSAASTEARGRVARVMTNSAEGKTRPVFEFGVEFINITGKGIPFIRRSELEAYVTLHTPVAATATAAPA